MFEDQRTLETNFCDIKTGQSVMEEFYNAKQEKYEDISTWAIRLETLIQKAINRNEIQEDKKDTMLRTRFWRQINNTELRNATRVYFETVSTFEELKVKVRREEQEMAVCKGTELPKESNVLHIDEQMKILKDLTEKMNLMEKKLNEMSREKPSQNRNESRFENRTSDQPNYRRGHIGRYRNMNRGRRFRSYRGQYPTRGYLRQDPTEQQPKTQHLN